MRTPPDVTTPADLIDELINAAQRVGCGDGTVSRVVALRAEVLALVIGHDPTRDAAIALCRDMAAWYRGGSQGSTPATAATSEVYGLATMARRYCTAQDQAVSWAEAATLLAKGWRP